jgi:magnesium chelatase family protein
MLAASEQIETDQLDNFVIVGELALTGGVQSCKGVLPIAFQARAAGKTGVLDRIDMHIEVPQVEFREMSGA